MIDIDPKSWHHLLHRPSKANKYDYGHILVLGGSETMIGAPVLVARAALRTGAGLVTVASTSEAVTLIDRDIEEIMTFSLPSWDDVEKSLAMLETFIKDRHVSVLVIGPGLPAVSHELARSLLSRIQLPMVIDAEAFTALRDHLSVLKSTAKINKNIVLTPHSGEYARLTKGKYRQADSKDFAWDYNITLVLKRHHTLVSSRTGETYQNTTGNPGLATAGSGDVLAGILAALLSQKIKPYAAAKMAVYLHGLAGDMAAELKSEPGMIASDIIENIPKALRSLDNHQR